MTCGEVQRMVDEQVNAVTCGEVKRMVDEQVNATVSVWCCGDRQFVGFCRILRQF